MGNFKIDLASFSNKIKEFYKVTDIMVTMDDNQYLLCDQISRLNDNQPLKEDCIRIRLMLILAYNQRQAIIGIPKTDELRKELTKWVRYMTKLQRDAISSLKPGPRMISKGGKSELMQVMKYQGINEEQLKRAMNLLG